MLVWIELMGGSHIAQLRVGPRTIGLATLMVYPQYEEVHITFTEIIKEMRGDKLNRKLLTGVFDYAAVLAEDTGTNVFVTVGGFTAKGKRSLLPTLEELSVEYSSRRVTFDSFQV